MFLINGIEQDTLAASDRAIQFGDGCFTTASWDIKCRCCQPISDVCSWPAQRS
jgi:branched-subunit amino acid aminotransferase/4-amino-4-deoxychorismate lyase